MEIRHLRYFLAVAETRNFTRAAAALGVAQPPLSRQIRELEEEIGATLFDRDSRPVALTEAGRLMVEHAERVVQAMTQLKSAMQAQAQRTRKRFVIGFVGSTIYGPIPDLIRRFREAAPDMELDLIEMNTVIQIGALKDGRIDAGLGRLLLEDAHIERRIIAREQMVVALPVDHRLAQGEEPIALHAIAAEPMILYPKEPRPSYADQVIAAFRQHDLRLEHIREVREIQTALGLVAAGAGVCVVPASVQRLHRDDVVYRPLAEQDAVSPITLSWRRGDSSDATALLLRLCADYTSV